MGKFNLSRAQGWVSKLAGILRSEASKTMQNQRVDGEAVAIQANSISFGLDGESVTKMFEVMVGQFQNTQQEIQQRVNKLEISIQEAMKRQGAKIDQDQLADPDVLATCFDAMRGAARRNSQVTYDLLAELVAARLIKGGSTHRDIVIAQAVQIVPKLTKEQIAFLTLVHATLFVNMPTISNLRYVEDFMSKILPFCEPGFDLDEKDKLFVASFGTCSVETFKMWRGDIFERIANSFVGLGFERRPAEFKAKITTDAPSWLRLLEQVIASDLLAVRLTTVGHAIAIAHVAPVFPEMDLKIWVPE